MIAHPDPRSFNHALAQAVGDAWTARGIATTTLDLHATGFDPVLTIDEARGRAHPAVAAQIAQLVATDLLAVGIRTAGVRHRR